MLWSACALDMSGAFAGQDLKEKQKNKKKSERQQAEVVR